MFFGYFTLFIALLISAVAAYYSIVGLTAIFAAAVIPIIIMGAALEVGKITAAVWLKLNWYRCNWTYKLYLVPAVAVLMLLTSMGIFGFLSKAHSDQNLVSGDVLSKIAIYDEKIKIARENIDANRRALKQLDEAVDQVMGRSTTETGAERSVQIRRQQAPERQRLIREIEAEQKKISSLNEERAPIAAEVRKVEAEVGPVKYIAALIYGDNADTNLLEAAVRWVIIIIVAVFDPLALVLILAAQQSIRWAKEEKLNEKPNYEKDDGPLMESQFNQITENIVSENESKDELLKKSDLFEQKTVFEKYPYLAKPFVHFKNLKPMPFKSEPDVSADKKIRKTKKKFNKKINDPKTPVTTDIIETENVTVEAKPKELPYKELDGGYVNFEGKLTSIEALKGMRPDLFLYESFKKPINSSFGTSFPKISNKGDIFIRVDILPNRVYKFDGVRWIEINKQTTDSYLHDQSYIKYLIKEIDEGKYDPELLSDQERQLIEEYLTKKD